MNSSLTPEPSAKAWFLRALLGPAQIIDGIFSTLSVGTFSPGLALRTARTLARARHTAICTKKA